MRQKPHINQSFKVLGVGLTLTPLELREMWRECKSNPQDLEALIDMWFLTQLDSRK